MKILNFYYFEFSTYILIICLAFIIAYAVFYQLLKKYISKIDIYYIYVINIIGFAVGAKLLSLFLNRKTLTLYNFINSGYSYIGGVIGSILVIVLYCKKYTLNFKDILSSFSVVYPLIYSICKIGCFLNNCCYGIIKIRNSSFFFPLQLIESCVMLGLFFFLLMQFNKGKEYIISKFLVVFSISRFLEDYYRYHRNIIVYNLTVEQIICFSLIIIGIYVFVFCKYKKSK